MTDEMGPGTHEPVSAAASSCHDEEFSVLLGGGAPESEYDPDALSPGADCFPLDGVIEAFHATARARSEALRTRSADLAREVLALAEQEVRDLLADDPSPTDVTERSRDIVARAQREVAEILAQGRNDAEVVELRAGQHAAHLRAQADSLSDEHGHGDDSEQISDVGIRAEPVTPVVADRQAPEAFHFDLPRPDADQLPERPTSQVLVSAQAILEEEPSTAATDQYFATLRAVPLPSEPGGLRYRVSGQLTLATMLAFQQAVGRLPGVNSAKVEPEPDDVAVLSMTTNDSSLVQRLLGALPGIRLQIDLA